MRFRLSALMLRSLIFSGWYLIAFFSHMDGGIIKRYIWVAVLAGGCTWIVVLVSVTTGLWY